MLKVSDVSGAVMFMFNSCFANFFYFFFFFYFKWGEEMKIISEKKIFTEKKKIKKFFS